MVFMVAHWCEKKKAYIYNIQFSVCNMVIHNSSWMFLNKLDIELQESCTRKEIAINFHSLENFLSGNQIVPLKGAKPSWILHSANNSQIFKDYNNEWELNLAVQIIF